MLHCCYCGSWAELADSCAICYHTPTKSCSCFKIPHQEASKSQSEVSSSQDVQSSSTVAESSSSAAESTFAATTGESRLSDEMEKYRQALERARSFEDDDEFFPGPLEAIKPTHLTTPDRPTGGSLFTPPAGPRKWRESRTKSAAIPIMQPPDAKNGQAKGGDTGLKPPPQARFWWKAPFPEDKNDEAYPYDGNW